MEWVQIEAAESITPAEDPETFHPAKGQAVMAADGRAIWRRSDGWFWVVALVDGETFWLTLESTGPLPGWMQYIEDTEGLTATMYPDHCLDGADLATALMAEGITPGEPFFVHMLFWSSRDYWGEYDEGVEWEVLDRGRASPEEAARQWADWLAEWRRDLSGG